MCTKITTTLALATVVLSTLSWARPGQVDNKMDRPCLKYDGDGCSIPFGLPFFYKTQFTPSCDRHDICYHCGVAYGIPRPRCDDGFRHDTLASCKSTYLSTPPISHAAISHRVIVLLTIERYGLESLEPVLHNEMANLTDLHPNPGFKDFLAWFSSREVQVRMLAEWIKILTARILQKDLEMPLEEQTDVENNLKQAPPPEETRGFSDKRNNKRIENKTKSIFFVPESKENKESHSNPFLSSNFKFEAPDDDGDTDWCTEIIEYFKANNQTIPLTLEHCPDIEYVTCNFFSEVYYLAVSIFAYSSYHQEAEFYCHQSFVPKCLPPH